MKCSPPHTDWQEDTVRAQLITYTSHKNMQRCSTLLTRRSLLLVNTLHWPSILECGCGVRNPIRGWSPCTQAQSEVRFRKGLNTGRRTPGWTNQNIFCHTYISFVHMQKNAHKNVCVSPPPILHRCLCSASVLPFRLEVQWVCGASVWVTLSRLLWVQQRPAVVIHVLSNLHLNLLNFHDLIGLKNVKEQDRDHHRATIRHFLCSTAIYCNHMYSIHIKARTISECAVTLRRQLVPINLRMLWKQPLCHWKLDNP